MGYVAFAQLDDVYKRLKADASQGGGSAASTVLIFVSPDADALCALKILVTLLKSDCIAHKVVPVAGYTDLSGANEDHVEDNEELRSIVMLNCGGLVDLTELFTLTNAMTVYVCDSHRPLNLRSLFGHDQIIFMDDGDVDDLNELRQAVEELEFEDSDDEDDDEFEEADDAEDENDGNDSSGDKPDGDEETSDIENDEDDMEDADMEAGGSRKRKRKPPESRNAGDLENPPKKARLARRAKRKRRQRHQRLIAEYYSEGAYYGLSVAGMLYNLATLLGRASNDFLWLALVGLSDQYLHDRVDHRQYSAQVSTYKGEVLRYNVTSGPGSQSTDMDDLESLFGESLDQQGRTDQSRHSAGPVIRCDDEFRLMLLRHWTMHESLHYSVYVGTKLGIWKERGRQRLTNFLVKMGLPHKESQQRFTEMSLPFKRSIKEKLIAVSPRFNMTEIVFPSFYKSFGFRGLMSAPDVVYSLTSLLDGGAEWIAQHGTGSGYPELMTTVGQLGGGSRQRKNEGAEADVFSGSLAGVGVGTRTGMAALAMRTGDMAGMPVDTDEEGSVVEEDAEDPGRKARKEKERAWVRNFYVAYDALDGFDLLQHGIHLAMNFQRALVQTGIAIIEKKLTQTLRNFQLTVLTGEGLGSGVDVTGALNDDNNFTLFGRSPAHLGRLAKFLVEAFKEFKEKDLPLVIAALNESADAFLIVGYAGMTRRGVIRRNTFGPAFQQAAEQTNANVKHDGFEASVMEVKREDLGDFLETLQNLMQ